MLFKHFQTHDKSEHVFRRTLCITRSAEAGECPSVSIVGNFSQSQFHYVVHRLTHQSS